MGKPITPLGSAQLAAQAQTSDALKPFQMQRLVTPKSDDATYADAVNQIAQASTAASVAGPRLAPIKPQQAQAGAYDEAEPVNEPQEGAANEASGVTESPQTVSQALARWYELDG